MKNLTLIILFFSFFSFGQSKKVVASEINWWGYKISKSKSLSHYGTIKLKSGKIDVKDGNVVGGSFVMDIKTIDADDVTGDTEKELNDHLKSDDFFAAKKYPKATFVITSVKPSNSNIYNYIIKGNLTIKGKTNPISFPAKISSSKGVVAIVSDKFTFNRQLFDVTYSYFLDALVQDDVEMKVKVTAK